MANLRERWGLGWFLLSLLAGALAAGPAIGQPARDKDAAPPTGSLRWVPEDAAFYSALLRNREQVSAVAKSRAWARLKALPAVQALWKKVREELTEDEGKLAPLYKFFQEEENKKLLALVGDLFSREVFCYGGENWGAFTELALQFNRLNLRIQAALFQLAGRGRDLNPGRQQ